MRIISKKFGYKTNHGKVKRFLERNPVTVQLELELEHFHDFDDAYEARWTVVRMLYEGWNKKSIADLLKLSRRHVTTLIQAFEKDGFAGLEDKRTRPDNHPDNQMTLPFMEKVFRAQLEYPDDEPKLYRTLFVSPQLELFELDDSQWQEILRRPEYVKRRAAQQLMVGNLRLIYP